MSRKNRLVPDDYASLLADVKERVRAAQYAALKAVNKELVALYWDIVRMTTERRAAGARGTAVVKRLAADLQAEFRDSRTPSCRSGRRSSGAGVQTCSGHAVCVQKDSYLWHTSFSAWRGPIRRRRSPS